MLQLDLVLDNHTGSMTDRERKKAVHQGEHEETESGAESSDLQTMMRFMMEESKRNEARRDSEAKRAEARQVAAEERAEIRRREEKIADEDRMEARRIAVEERADAKRVAEAKALREFEAESRIAAEERAEAKRVAEAKTLREFELEREEAARLASIRLAEQQEAMAKRAYEQQMELMRVQAELGETAVKTHREKQVVERKKDKAISSISMLREEDDIEEYLLTVEKRLEVGGVKEEDWVAIVACKLSGKIGSIWQDVSATVEGYKEVKGRVLKVCGHTPKLAAELYYGFRIEHSKGLTADQLYYRGKQLFRRMIAPRRVEEETEFTILRGWISSVVPRRARMALEARNITNAVELVDALQDYLIMEGGRTEGQAAVFKKGYESEGGRERAASIICFKCGRPGHKAVDCGVEENRFSLPTAGFSSSPRKLTCFSCGVEGHKSTQCPNRNGIVKTEPHIKAEPKEIMTKPIKRIKSQLAKENVLWMTVNGQPAPVLLDSGSAITIVPETMVAQAQKTGETVTIRGYGARQSLVLPLAEIPFEIEQYCWKEKVALAPAEEGDEIVFALDIVSTRGLQLVLLATQRKQQGKDVSTGEEKLAEDRPASGPDPVVNEEEIVEQKDEVEFLVEEEEEEEEVEERVFRLRRLEILDSSSKDFSVPEPGVVGGNGRKLEALHQQFDVSDFDFYTHLCSSAPESEDDEVDSAVQLRGVSPHRRKSEGEDWENSFVEQPQEEPRTAPVFFVGGDVGTAHSRRKREKEKEKEEDKEQERENKEPFM